MIVNIRGTSGSGKSHIVHGILKQGHPIPQFKDGRKRPMGYVLEPERLFVVGSYETPCGGCDTIMSQDEIYDLIRDWARQGYNVLYEGLFASVEVRRTILLNVY